ncbi:MAG: hypothetical protein M3O50_15990 [Myxococcota bacterium]|nr:hypothetical protein [Myxococcota bacterium]
MRRVPLWSFGAAVGALLCACAAPPTAIAKAQQNAQELNDSMRFGRNEIALEHVAPAARDAFMARHRAWGSSVRLADVELAGMHAHGQHDVDVIVRVAWYRPDEEELRVTTLKQLWSEAGGWKLVDEQRLEGDIGLLGEPVVYAAPPGGREPAQFPTIRLGRGAAP